MKKRVLKLGLAAMAFALGSSFALDAYAQMFAQTCSFNPEFNVPLPASGSGIISTTVANIGLIVNGLAYNMYNTIVFNPDFQGAARAALSLYIVMYGVMFMGGMTQISLQDFVLRAVKFGIVVALLAPDSWNFFYTYVGGAFQSSKDELIAIMSSIAVGGVVGVVPQYPFAVLDNAIAIVTSSKMAVTLVATFFTGPYGLIFGLLIVMGLGSFASSLFQAMWVYLMSMVVTAFLFAIAPIFFTFLLFARTRNLFDGWLNQLVSATLQPVMLFTFFAFFSSLVQASLWKLLNTPVCWTTPGDIWRGSPFDVQVWRFMVPVNTGFGMTWQMYGGEWSFTGADTPGAPVFPLSIVDVLVFVIIVQLASRFNGIVLHIAKDIAGASLNLDVAGKMAEWMSPAKGHVDALTKRAGEATERYKEAQAKTQEKRPPPGGGGGAKA